MYPTILPAAMGKLQGRAGLFIFVVAYIVQCFNGLFGWVFMVHQPLFLTECQILFEQIY